MSTIWSAPAPSRVLNLRGAPVPERPSDAGDDDATGSESKPSITEDPPVEDVAGAARGPRVGRIDAWRDQGFASAREQRDALKSDLGRYNLRRRRQGRAPLTEDEFDAMIAAGGDEVSSISGSDDSDSDSDSDDDDDDAGGATKDPTEAYTAVRGAAEGARVVFKDDSAGDAYAVWRCVLERDGKNSRTLDADSAVRALKTLRDDAKPWAVVLARGGHFAASVFDPTKFAGGAKSGERVEKKPKGPIENAVPPAAAIVHKTFHRYVVRAKAGGRQSTKDAGGGKTIKSAGSSMRRANERALEEEIRACLSGWNETLERCALVFVAASKTDQKTLFDAPGKGKEPCLGRGNDKIRRVPFATRRPTFNETRRVVARLASVSRDVVIAGGAEGGAEGGADTAGEAGDALTDAQRERMSQIESRAAAAAAALRGLDVGGGDVGGDGDALGGDGGDDIDVRKPLSKKEKEKLKKQRAKERAKAAAAEEEGKAPEASAEEAPAPAQNAKKGGGPSGGGKAAALLAKAKRGEANKRDAAVRFHRAHTRSTIPVSPIHPSLPGASFSRRVSTDFPRPSPQSEERRASGRRSSARQRSSGRRTGGRSPTKAAGPSLVDRLRGVDLRSSLPKVAMAVAAVYVMSSARVVDTKRSTKRVMR